jgi:hypothetical protein
VVKQRSKTNPLVFFEAFFRFFGVVVALDRATAPVLLSICLLPLGSV